MPEPGFAPFSSPPSTAFPPPPGRRLSSNAVGLGFGKRRSAEGDDAGSKQLATISSGWLESPYGERASVTIVRQPTRLVVWHGEVATDRGRNRTTIYQGRSVVEATKRANQMMHTLRLRGFRARQGGSFDRDFAVGEVSRTLNVAIDQ
jgi:hypothetical protein